MSRGNGRREEEARLRAQAEEANRRAAEAATAVARVDPLEERRRAHVTRWDDWRTGVNGPVDVRAMPDQIGMSLFRDAKQARDAGRIGRGYGMLNDGANPAHAAALGQELEAERGLAASGALEDYVTDQNDATTRELYGLVGASGDRSRYLAELAMRRSGIADERLSRHQANRRPGFLQQLALGALGNVSFARGGLSI